MFSVESILAGWFKFRFLNSEHSWNVSYLTNAKTDLDYAFNLNHEESKHIILEMESLGDMLIQTYRDYDFLFISCYEMHTDRGYKESFRVKYNDFIRDYIKALDPLEDIYMKHFCYIDDDYLFDSGDYSQLKDKLKDK